MLLPPPQPSRWDLHGRMLGAEVRIRPIFWVSCVLLGLPYYQYPGIGGVGAFCFWGAAVLFSLLAHETSHILIARFFGATPRVVLSGLGGQMYGLEELKRGQRVLVLLAGALGNLLIYGALYVAISERSPLTIDRFPEAWRPFLVNAVWVLMMINALWCLLNVLPLWPLDGGRIAVEVGEALLGQRGQTLALLLSLLVCLLMTVSVIVWGRLSLINPFDERYRIYLTFFCVMALYCYVFWLVTFRALWGDSPPLDESGKPGRAA